MARLAAGRDPVPAPVLGPTARAAASLPVGGNKRRKLALLIGAYIDAGINDPSIRMLAMRTGLDARVVVTLVDRLERDGFLAVDRRRGERNRYSLIDDAG